MAWRQELWRRQRTYLAAEKDETQYVCAPPSVVALSYTSQKKKKKDRQHRQHRHKKDLQSNSVSTNNEDESEQRDRDDGEVASAARPRKKRSASFKRAVEKIKHLAATSDDEDEADKAEFNNKFETAATRDRGHHSPRRRAEGATPRGDLRVSAAADAAASEYDMGANQIHAMAWFQRLSAAARPQRAS